MALELFLPQDGAVEAAEIGKHTKQSDVWAYGMVLYVRDDDIVLGMTANFIFIRSF